ncbi:MAG: hypothetical protein OXH69_03520 [Acidobacteria bacterium]|nr:hypothetical protein [Acidobacteriota bacterium]
MAADGDAVRRCEHCGAAVEGDDLEVLQARVRAALDHVEALPAFQSARGGESVEVRVAAALADALDVLDPVVRSRRSSAGPLADDTARGAGPGR